MTARDVNALGNPRWRVLVDLAGAIGRGVPSGAPGDLSRLIGRRTTPIAELIAAALASRA